MSAAVLAAEKTVDHAAEFCAATAAVKRHHFDALEAVGVSRRFMFYGPMRFGVSNIVTSGKFYQPVVDGAAALVVPAIPLPPPWEDDFVGHDPGDLVAFAIGVPRRWWLRTGAMPVLNPAALDRAEVFREPLNVRSSPLSWLRHSGDGCVAIDHTANLRLLLGGVRRIVGDDRATAEALDLAWQRRERRPEIHVAVSRGV